MEAGLAVGESAFEEVAVVVDGGFVDGFCVGVFAGDVEWVVGLADGGERCSGGVDCEGELGEVWFECDCVCASVNPVCEEFLDWRWIGCRVVVCHWSVWWYL